MYFIEKFRNWILSLSEEIRIAILLLCLIIPCTISSISTYVANSNWQKNNKISFTILEIDSSVLSGRHQHKYHTTEYAYYQAKIQYCTGKIDYLTTTNVFEFKNWKVGQVRFLASEDYNYTKANYKVPFHYGFGFSIIFMILPALIVCSILLTIIVGVIVCAIDSIIVFFGFKSFL